MSSQDAGHWKCRVGEFQEQGWCSTQLWKLLVGQGEKCLERQVGD